MSARLLTRRFSRPTGVRLPCVERLLTKTEEEETIIINRPDRSTYAEEKSVLRSGATPQMCRQFSLLHCNDSLSNV